MHDEFCGGVLAGRRARAHRGGGALARAGLGRGGRALPPRPYGEGGHYRRRGPSQVNAITHRATARIWCKEQCHSKRAEEP